MNSKAKNLVISATMFLSCLLFFFACSQESGGLQGGLSRYLPQSDEVGGWIRNDIPQEYKGEDLYLYINGGAEIYHEYGFKEIIEQEYINANGKSISLEIFEMENDEAAYGIYTFKRSSEGKRLALGNEGQVEDYYLNFWKGNYLVTLTGFDEEEETVEGLVMMAKSVDAKIESKGKIPSLLSLLADEGLMKLSIKYFKGNLGLYNSYRFFTKDVFGLRDGIKGSYKGGFEVFIFKYKDSKESHKRLQEASRSFRESPRYKNFRPVDEAFQVIDSNDRFIFIKSFQKYILVVLGARSRSAAKEILDSIQENISREKGDNPLRTLP